MYLNKWMFVWLYTAPWWAIWHEHKHRTQHTWCDFWQWLPKSSLANSLFQQGNQNDLVRLNQSTTQVNEHIHPLYHPLDGECWQGDGPMAESSPCMCSNVVWCIRHTEGRGIARGGWDLWWRWRTSHTTTVRCCPSVDLQPLPPESPGYQLEGWKVPPWCWQKFSCGGSHGGVVLSSSQTWHWQLAG